MGHAMSAVRVPPSGLLRRLRLAVRRRRARAQAAADEALARSADGVDRSWYLETYPDVGADGADPVLHYLRFGWREGRDPRPDFSTLGYLTLHDDVARSGQNPLIHYLRNGGPQAAARGGEATHWHALRRDGLLYPKLGQPPTAGPYGTPGRRKILFAGHEATRTGAPLILLALMEAIERLTGAELFLLLERDGPVLESYRRIAHVVVNRNGLLYRRPMRPLLDQIAEPAPDLAICNCAETWQLAAELRRAGVPRIGSLVHERLSRYAAEPAGLLHANADLVIFPAQAVKQDAVRAYPEYRDADVIPQGLLNDAFGRSDKAAARRAVRAELGLGADTRIVLGCGVRAPRKGLDLFVQLAARVRARSTAPLHFLWLGGDGRPTQFKFFVEHDIALLGLGASVSLVAETTDTERYFLAADVYALTSRDDPFPCVVHDAMACALPVVGFSDAGGAGEALADGCGIMVPYLDLDAMAHHIATLIERPADAAAIGEKAERRVRTQYRFADYARRILAICGEPQADRGAMAAPPRGETIAAG